MTPKKLTITKALTLIHQLCPFINLELPKEKRLALTMLISSLSCSHIGTRMNEREMETRVTNFLQNAKD